MNWMTYRSRSTAGPHCSKSASPISPKSIMEKLPDNLATALDARDKGIAAIPCYPGTKVPMVKWKRYQTELPTAETLAELFTDARVNVAIVTTGMVLFDVDDLAQARQV